MIGYFDFSSKIFNQKPQSHFSENIKSLTVKKIGFSSPSKKDFVKKIFYQQNKKHM